MLNSHITDLTPAAKCYIIREWNGNRYRKAVIKDAIAVATVWKTHVLDAILQILHDPISRTIQSTTMVLYKVFKAFICKIYMYVCTCKYAYMHTVTMDIIHYRTGLEANRAGAPIHPVLTSLV